MIKLCGVHVVQENPKLGILLILKLGNQQPTAQANFWKIHPQAEGAELDEGGFGHFQVWQMSELVSDLAEFQQRSHCWRQLGGRRPINHLRVY